MEQKNRLVIAVLITLLIVGAVFASFGRGLFASSPPRVILPQADASGQNPGGDVSHGAADPVKRVEVTPQTVQSVIASLERSSSYYQEVTVENLWGDSSQAATVLTWVDGEWSHVRQTLPSGLVRHDLVGDGQVYYWYEGSKTWRTAPADELSADLARHLPTYETVLTLDPASITETGYETRGDIPCVYVRVASAVAGYEECYWVSVDSGLLVCAETLDEGELTYRMTAYGAIISPCPQADGVFTLPDGTVLHSL